jgi:hypothetical protein
VGHLEGDLKHTNLSLSCFAGDLTEAKGIINKELIVWSKIMPTAFFVVDMKGHYNMFLGKIRYMPKSVCPLLFTSA